MKGLTSRILGAACPAAAAFGEPRPDPPRDLPGWTAAEHALEEAMLRAGVRPATARRRATQVADRLPPQRLTQFARCRKKLRLARRLLGRRPGHHQRDILRARERRASATHGR
jgi:hypothetical protein